MFNFNLSVKIYRSIDYYKYGINYVENKYGYYNWIDNLKSNIVAPIVRKLGLSNIIRKILN